MTLVCASRLRSSTSPARAIRALAARAAAPRRGISRASTHWIPAVQRAPSILVPCIASTGPGGGGPVPGAAIIRMSPSIRNAGASASEVSDLSEKPATTAVTAVAPTTPVMAMSPLLRGPSRAGPRLHGSPSTLPGDQRQRVSRRDRLLKQHIEHQIRPNATIRIASAFRASQHDDRAHRRASQHRGREAATAHGATSA